MQLLEPHCYFGLEPDREQVAVGLERFVGADVVADKRPRFAYNAAFDLTEFETTFSFFMLRSVWTHCAKQHIEQSLDAFAEFAEPDGKLLASVVFPRFVKHREIYRLDYKGNDWVGRDHRAKIHGGVAHSWRWLRKTCSAHGLRVDRVDRRPINHQHWVVVRRR